MRILEIYIQGFGKISNKKFTFSDGINVLYGKNEAGKSTIHNFIRAIFYGLERGRGRAGKNDLWSRFEPWEKGAYGGYIRVSKNDIIYRIERDFTKNALKPFSIVDEIKGIEIDEPNSILAELLNNLSQTAYTNTISIGQLRSVTDAGMANELRNYIANMNNTGNESLNISKASAYLKLQRKNIASDFIEEASKAYTSNLARLQDLEKKLNETNASIPDEKKEAETVSNDITQYQIELGLLERYIKNNEEILDSIDFDDLEELKATEESFKEKVQAYKEDVANNSIKKERIFSTILTIISLLTAVLAAYLFISGQNNFITNIFKINYDSSISILVILCTLSTVVLGILSRMISSKLSQKTYIKNTLSVLIESLIGSREINPENIEKVATLIRDYKQSSTNIEQAKAKIKELSEGLNNLQVKRKSIHDNIEETQKKLWESEKLSEQISNISDENIALKTVIEKNNLIADELSAIDLALETLNKLSISIKDSFGLYLNKETSKLISKITDGVYSSISIDKDMNVFLNTSRKLIPIEQVSSGTADQVYLALRLASAGLLQQDTEKLPLILDDSFVNYDKQRLSAALGFLSDNYDAQIFLFTCHRREARILASLDKKYNMIEV